MLTRQMEVCDSSSSRSRDTPATHLTARLPDNHRGDRVGAGLVTTKKRPLAQTQRPQNGAYRQGHIFWPRLLMLENAMRGDKQTGKQQARDSGLEG